MGRGSTDLDNYEYDRWLADNHKEKELISRKQERRSANKGYRGWHFGIGDKPVYTETKEEFRQELKKRGLGIYDEARPEKRSDNLWWKKQK